MRNIDVFFVLSLSKLLNKESSYGHLRRLNADVHLITQLKLLLVAYLTHCGLVTSYIDIGLGQHWLR